MLVMAGEGREVDTHPVSGEAQHRHDRHWHSKNQEN